MGYREGIVEVLGFECVVVIVGRMVEGVVKLIWLFW